MLLAVHGAEAAALEIANDLIDRLPADRRLNVRRLYPNKRRRTAGMPVKEAVTQSPDEVS
jgi:hypothetical protein